MTIPPLEIVFQDMVKLLPHSRMRRGLNCNAREAGQVNVVFQEWQFAYNFTQESFPLQAHVIGHQHFHIGHATGSTSAWVASEVPGNDLLLWRSFAVI